MRTVRNLPVASIRGCFQHWNLGILAVCLVYFLAAPHSHAQSLAGMYGVVTDSTGAAVSEANVSVTNSATGVVNHAVTSSAGTYVITDLIPGVYTVSIEKAGFKVSTHNGVYVDPSAKSTVNAVLQPGSVSEKMEVTAQAITLQTEQPEIGTTIETKMVQEIPVQIGGVNGGVGNVGRQIDDYLFLAPGVQGGEFSHRINGGVDFQNEVLFNGIPAIQAETQGFQSFINPPFEMVNEFKVLGSVFSAQYGLAQGVAAYQFASGTNTLHGDGFEIMRNDFFDAPGANPPEQFTDSKGVLHKKVPVDKEHNFGGSVGGPVYIPKIYDGRNKTFFYTTVERYQLNQSTGSPMTVPTAQERGGDFTDYPFPLFTPAGNWTPPAGCPLTVGAPIPGNMIPSSCFSQTSVALLKFLPNPNLPGSGTPVQQNLSSQVGVVPIRQNSWGFSIDHNLTQTQRLHGSFWRDKTTNPACCDNSAFYPANNPLTGLNPQLRLGTGIFLTYSNTLSNHLVMTAGAGWMGEINNQNNAVTNFNYPGVANSISLGAIFFDGPAPDQPGTWGQSRTFSINRKLGISFVNNWLYTRGRHTWNIGWEIRRAYQDDHECQQCAGNIHFASQSTSNGTPAGGGPLDVTNTGSAFASFLLGVVDNADRHFTSNTKLRNFYIAPYVQDNIKITPKLTVDVGLRWDILRPFTENSNNIVFFDPSRPNPAVISTLTGQPLLGAANKFGKCSGCAGFEHADIHWRTFSPRLGFAYQLNDKTVLLSGFALNFLDTGASEFGSHKVANDYGQQLDGTFQSNASVFNLPGFGEWDNNPIPAPGLTPFSPTLNLLTSSLHMFTRDPSKPGYSQAWNAGIQRELPKNMFLSVSYIGNRAVHMPSQLNNPNYIPQQFLALGPILDDSWTTPRAQAALQAAGFGQIPAGSNGAGLFAPYTTFMDDWGPDALIGRALREFPQYRGMSFNFDSAGTVTYNALQAQAQKRFSAGASFLVAYTLSRTMSNTDTAFPTFNSSALNKFNPKSEWSIASNDQTHILSISGVYELPIGPGKPLLNRGGTLARNILGGWQISGVASYSSGQPFGIAASGTPLFGGSNRANISPGVPFNLDWNNYYTFGAKPVLNPSAFSDPGDFAVGTSPRNISSLRNPWNLNESIGLGKRLYAGERVSAELRMEFFNILNRMQICGGPNQNGSMDSNIADSTFGLISGGGACQNNRPRQGQAFFKITF
jgi:hypothetical protein